MARKPRGVVLDSWAVLAFLEDEEAGLRVAERIAQAHEQEIPLLMSVVNAGEVWYITARRISEAAADEALREMLDLGIQIRDVDWKQTRLAAQFKSKHKMSYADTFATALAQSEKASLVTGDPEFLAVNAAVSISWVGQPKR